MLNDALLIRLQQQPMSVPLLMCYHRAIIQGRHDCENIELLK